MNGEEEEQIKIENELDDSTFLFPLLTNEEVEELITGTNFTMEKDPHIDVLNKNNFESWFEQIEAILKKEKSLDRFGASRSSREIERSG